MKTKFNTLMALTATLGLLCTAASSWAQLKITPVGQLETLTEQEMQELCTFASQFNAACDQAAIINPVVPHDLVVTVQESVPGDLVNSGINSIRGYAVVVKHPTVVDVEPIMAKGCGVERHPELPTPVIFSWGFVKVFRIWRAEDIPIKIHFEIQFPASGPNPVE